MAGGQGVGGVRGGFLSLGFSVEGWQEEGTGVAPAVLHARGLGASADDGKRTLHAMKRSFTFIPLLEHPLTC